MSDLGQNDGGETVFTEAWPVGLADGDRLDEQTVSKLSYDTFFVHFVGQPDGYPSPLLGFASATRVRRRSSLFEGRFLGREDGT